MRAMVASSVAEMHGPGDCDVGIPSTLSIALIGLVLHSYPCIAWVLLRLRASQNKCYRSLVARACMNIHATILSSGWFIHPCACGSCPGQDRFLHVVDQRAAEQILFHARFEQPDKGRGAQMALQQVENLCRIAWTITGTCWDQE